MGRRNREKKWKPQHAVLFAGVIITAACEQESGADNGSNFSAAETALEDAEIALNRGDLQDRERMEKAANALDRASDALFDTANAIDESSR